LNQDGASVLQDHLPVLQRNPHHSDRCGGGHMGGRCPIAAVLDATKAAINHEGDPARQGVRYFVGLNRSLKLSRPRTHAVTHRAGQAGSPADAESCQSV
jgi:hypothetical protein